jgi:hypothetical protein
MFSHPNSIITSADLHREDLLATAARAPSRALRGSCATVAYRRRPRGCHRGLVPRPARITWSCTSAICLIVSESPAKETCPTGV